MGDVGVPVLVGRLGAAVGLAAGCCPPWQVVELGRVGGHEAAAAVHQAPHVFGLGGITAEQVVLPALPLVAGLDARFKPRGGGLVGVAQAAGRLRQ